MLNKKSAGKVYVIAEVGSNWKTHDDLINSINMAKAAGADAVKFQYFRREELYGPAYELDSEFPLEKLASKARFIGIDFLCSAFSPEGVARVDPFVEAHKVASSEMAHIRILEAVKKTGKPVILSTGAYHCDDIKRSIDFFGKYTVIPMHCNISYPTKLTDLKKLQRMLYHKLVGIGKVWGYSDHTLSIDAVPAFLCGILGASVYEKHFNPFDLTDTPDAPHSLNQNEFKIMCSYLNGQPIDGTEENEARLMHVRRIIALRDLKPGDTLKEGENIGIFRSKKPDTNGASPFLIRQLEGKSVNREIQLGDGVSVSDVG
jgi:sialic acid synthase SpsE